MRENQQFRPVFAFVSILICFSLPIRCSLRRISSRLKLLKIICDVSLQDMKEELLQYKDVVNSIQLLSTQVIPLKERRKEVKEPRVVSSVCDNNQATVFYLL